VKEARFIIIKDVLKPITLGAQLRQGFVLRWELIRVAITEVRLDLLQRLLVAARLPFIGHVQTALEIELRLLQVELSGPHLLVTA